MGKLLTIFGLCLLAGLIYFFSESTNTRGERRDSLAPSTGQNQGAVAPSGIDDQPPLASPNALDRAELETPNTKAREELGSSRGSRREATRTRLHTLEGTLIARSMPHSGGQLTLYAGKEVIGHAESNRKGAFQLKFEVPAKDLVLRIATRGFALLERDLGNRETASLEFLGNLFLQDGSPLAGRVTDQADKAVAGAEVLMSQIVGIGSNKHIGEKARTDREGRFHFGSAPGGRINLSVTAKGYGLESTQHIHSPGKEVLIKLNPGLSLRVTVTDTKGQPVPDARLSLRSNRGHPARQAFSDEAGLAEFENLLSSDWSLSSITPGYRPGILARIPSGSKQVSLVLKAWPRARGKVRAPRGSELPEETEVVALLVSQRGDFRQRSPRGKRIAEDGSYEVLDLRPGHYCIRASAPGFAPTDSSAFDVIDGSDALIPDLVLQRGGEVTLKLKVKSKPVAGVYVETLRQFPRPGRLWMESQTPINELPLSDSEGTVHLQGQSPGELWLILRRDGLVPLQIGPISVLNGKHNQLERPYVMHEAGSIKGQLRTDSGAKLGLGRVRLSGTGMRSNTKITDQSGRFKFDNLAPGTYFLLPTGTIAGTVVEGTPREVFVVAGKATDLNISLSTE